MLSAHPAFQLFLGFGVLFRVDLLTTIFMALIVNCFSLSILQLWFLCNFSGFVLLLLLLLLLSVSSLTMALGGQHLWWPLIKSLLSLPKTWSKLVQLYPSKWRAAIKYDTAARRFFFYPGSKQQLLVQSNRLPEMLMKSRKLLSTLVKLYLSYFLFQFTMLNGFLKSSIKTKRLEISVLKSCQKFQKSNLIPAFLHFYQNENNRNQNPIE